jgi:hypothetical protein
MYVAVHADRANTGRHVQHRRTLIPLSGKCELGEVHLRRRIPDGRLVLPSIAKRHAGRARSERLRSAPRGPYMALSCWGRWPFLDGPRWFWVGLDASESVAIA